MIFSWDIFGREGAGFGLIEDLIKSGCPVVVLNCGGLIDWNLIPRGNRRDEVTIGDIFNGENDPAGL